MERRTYVHTTPFHTSEVYRYARDEGFEQAEHFFVKTGKVRDTWCDLPSAHVKTSSMEVYFPWSPTPRMVVVVSIFRVEEDVIEVQGHCEGVGKVHARCTFEAYESGFERTIEVDAVADAAAPSKVLLTAAARYVLETTAPRVLDARDRIHAAMVPEQ